MSIYSEFFFSSPPDVTELDLLEIYHPNFSQTYYLVRNQQAGVTVMHEGAVGPFVYSYLPMSIKPLGSSTDLDQEIEINMGDVGEVISTELELVANSAIGFFTKPIAYYRTYRSDDLTAPLFGPVRLRIDGFSFNREGASFRAKAASFNVSRTGEIYRTEIFPMIAPLA